MNIQTNPFVDQLIKKYKSEDVRALIDGNSFYASCEISRNQEYLLKPVIVCRDNDIVLAANYIARKFGIKTGTPSREAKKLLGNNGVYIEPDMKFYSKMSNDIFNYIGQHSDEIQNFSIDEAFCKWTSYCDKSDCISYGNLIQDSLKEKFFMPMSVGIGSTKILAKIFAEVRKPMGVCAMFDDYEIQDFLSTIPITNIPFISYRSNKRFEKYKLQTAKDFYDLDYNIVKKVMGESGVKIWRELHGVNSFNFTHGKAKSIGRSRSFHPNFTTNKAQVRHHLHGNFERAYTELLENKAVCGSISIYFRTREKVTNRRYGFESFGDYKELGFGTEKRQELEKLLKELFEKNFIEGVYYRSTGIHFGNLHYPKDGTLYLFDKVTAKNSRQIIDIIDKLNNSMGSRVIRFCEEEKPNLISYTI